MQTWESLDFTMHALTCNIVSGKHLRYCYDSRDLLSTASLSDLKRYTPWHTDRLSITIVRVQLKFQIGY